MEYLQVVYAFFACLGGCLIFNVRGKELFFMPLGGAVGWLVYLLAAPFGSDIFQNFVGTVVLSVYAEVMARLRRKPATGYLLVALFPLVPGGGIYYTMEYCIAGNTDLFLETGLHTLGVAGVLALGVLLVSSVVRMFNRSGWYRETNCK